MSTDKQLSERPAIVQAWIDDYQKSDVWKRKFVDCPHCGWPHDKHVMCGLGATFGKARIGGEAYSVDVSNVESLRQFVADTPAGFHWRHEVFFAGEKEGVRISRVDRYNNTPHRKSWLVPWPQWDSIINSVEQDRPADARAVIEADRSQQVDEIDGLKRQIAEWVAANGPGGWIDDLRRKLAQGEPAASALIDNQGELINFRSRVREFFGAVMDDDAHQHERDDEVRADEAAAGRAPHRATLLFSATQLAQPETHDSVRIPIGEDEAAMMVLLGTNWLKAHAPGRLAQPRGEPWMPEVKYGPRTHICWTPDNPKSPNYGVKMVLITHADYLRVCALAAPQAAVPAENSEHQSAALVGEPFLPKDSPGHSV